MLKAYLTEYRPLPPSVRWGLMPDRAMESIDWTGFLDEEPNLGGFRAGDVVTYHYDSPLGTVVLVGSDRLVVRYAGDSLRLHTPNELKLYRAVGS